MTHMAGSEERGGGHLTCVIMTYWVKNRYLTRPLAQYFSVVDNDFTRNNIFTDPQSISLGSTTKSTLNMFLKNGIISTRQNSDFHKTAHFHFLSVFENSLK